jgi:hypothetical protein
MFQYCGFCQVLCISVFFSVIQTLIGVRIHECGTSPLIRISRRGKYQVFIKIIWINYQYKKISKLMMCISLNFEEKKNYALFLISN